MSRGAGIQHDDNDVSMQMPFCSNIIAFSNLPLHNLVVFSFSDARELLMWAISIYIYTCIFNSILVYSIQAVKLFVLPLDLILVQNVI